MKPSNADFREIFNAAAETYDGATNPYALERRVEFVAAHAQGRVLEVGAGTGEIARALGRRHAVVATDISPRMVAIMERKGVDARVCDAEKLPFDDASFDTVVAGEVVYYLDRPERFFSEAARVLRPGGTLIMTSATRIAAAYDLLRSVLRMLRIGHTYFEDHMHRFPALGSLRAYLKDSGYSIENEERLIVVPFARLDALNRVLEVGPLRHLAAFAALSARRL